MRLLMIAPGFLPYMFSENLCNGKLVYAFKEVGIEVDVISKADSGPTYNSEWTEPWTILKNNTYEIAYPLGNKISRLYDFIYSGLTMKGNFVNSIRWARRAYEKALSLVSTNKYDAVLTRSPNDIAHLVGYMLKKKTGIRWIANWNDPADPIWPGPYKHHYSSSKQRKLESYTIKLLRNADINTFPSDTLRQHFIEHFPFLKDAHTEVIPHIGQSSTIFQKLTFPKRDKMYMCHSGNLSGERDPEPTFKAMRALKEEGVNQFHLDIMGHSTPNVKDLVEKYSLQDYVSFIGSFDYLDSVNKLQEYDVLVLLEARLDKGIFFASKFTDYAQTGKPILAISPKVGFAKEMTTKYHSGIFADNTDINSIKGGIKQLVGLWNEDRLAEITSTTLFNEFSPEMVVSKYKEIIR